MTNKRIFTIEEKIAYYERRRDHAISRIAALRSELTSKNANTSKVVGEVMEAEALAKLIIEALEERKKKAAV